MKNYSFNAITITDEVLENAYRKAQDLVRSIEPDRLLVKFQETAGIPKKTEPYTDSWECYMTGYYLTAVAQLYEATRAKDLKDRLEYVLEQFVECQSYDGYLFSGERELFDSVEQGTSTNAPWFSMYKILESLLNVYTTTGMKQALHIAEQLGNWIYWRVKNWKEEVRTRVLATEYGGMNDCLYRLYEVTKKAEYLVAAGQFDELELFQAIVDGKDIPKEKNRATAILKLKGALNRYMALGNTEEFYLKAAVSFFDMLMQSTNEMTAETKLSGEAEDRKQPKCSCETCSIYNQLKFAKQLFLATNNKKYMEAYEQFYFELIFGVQNSKSDTNTPLQTGYARVLEKSLEEVTCCKGAGMECFTSLADAIYMQDGQTVYVNLLIDSILTDAVPGIVLQQKTEFEKKNRTVFLVETESEKKFTLCIRVPKWANGHFSVSVNEQETDYAMKKGYVYVERAWQDGDRLSLQLYAEGQFSALPDVADILRENVIEDYCTDEVQAEKQVKKKKERIKKSKKNLKIVAACLIPVVLFGSTFLFHDSLKKFAAKRVSFVAKWFTEKESENLAMLVPSVTPVLREVYEENLAQKINETVFPDGYMADVVTVENLEYLMLQKEDLIVYYLNEKTEGGKQVLVNNGKKTETFHWEYDFSDLLALCPRVGSFNGFERQQFVFLHETKQGQIMHILNANSLTEYYVEEFETALKEAFTVSAYVPVEQGMLLEAKANNIKYTYALPKETVSPLDYVVTVGKELYFEPTDGKIAFTSYVTAGELYLGELRGTLQFNGTVYALERVVFYAYAEHTYGDMDSASLLYPVTKEDRSVRRITTYGDLGENLLVRINEDLPQNLYATESFVKTDGEYTYVENGVVKSKKGVDVSKYQADIDWEKVAADGVEFAMLRLGFRGMGTNGTCELDPYFIQNIEGALAAGIEVGVYFFSQAITVEEAVEEAEFVIQYLKDYPITYPVAYDTEAITSYPSARANRMPKELRTDCAIAFMDTIAAAGYKPMLYANTGWLIMKLDLERLSAYDLWYAYYGDDIYYPYHFTMWQYTSSGKVNGIPGTVDMNIYIP